MRSDSSMPVAFLTYIVVFEFSVLGVRGGNSHSFVVGDFVGAHL